MRLFVAQYFAVASIVLATASPLSASIQVNDVVRLSNGKGSPGGIFHVNDLNDGPANSIEFDTFCVELTEYISFGTDYIVQGIGLQTVNGGKTLQPKTAWLYNSFLDGALSSFNPTKLRDANALQLAIWLSIGYLENDVRDEIGDSWYDTYFPVLSAKSWDADFSGSGWVGTGTVRIMNLVNSNNGYNAQDQLFRDPTPPGGGVPSAPEAASFLIWGLIISCVTIVTGRRRY